MIRFNTTLRARLRAESDGGSALLGAVLFSVIIAGMVVVLLSIIVTAVYPAALAQARGRTVYNAEAGLQSALGILRAAKVSPATVDPKTGSYLGDRSKLPCSITGATDGVTTGQEKYLVSLRYYLDNPSGKDDTWRAANALPCPLSSTQPYFALIEATGSTGPVASSGSAGDRKLSAIYEFTVSNERILGGRIWTYGGGKYCLEATGTPPASGEPSPVINVKFTPAAQCTTANNPRQLWQYTTSWQLMLSSTAAADGSGGYCITAPNQVTTTTTTPEVRTTESETWLQTGEALSGQTTSPTYIRRTTADPSNRSFNATERARTTAYNQVQYTASANTTASNWYTYASSAISGTPTVSTVNNAYGAGTQQVTTTTTYRDRYNRSTTTPTSRYVLRVQTLVEKVVLATSTTTTSNSYVAELHPCVAVATSYGWAQQFAWNGNATWWGRNESGTHNSISSTACLWSGKYSSGAETAWTLGATNLLEIGKPTKVTTGAEVDQERCASQQYWGSFNPEPAVGAGRATPDFVDGQAVPVTKQLVSFKEFGRCADVTEGNINYGYNIIYPCKQDPISNSFDWNHKWNYNSPTVGYTNTTAIWVNNGSNMCLQTPDSTTSNKYPTWIACTGNPASATPTAARQKWTRYEYTGVYSRSYIFVDQWNRCLTADSTDTYVGAGQAWSKMTVAPCNGSESQKWNAPAYLTDASFGDYREISG